MSESKKMKNDDNSSCADNNKTSLLSEVVQDILQGGMIKGFEIDSLDLSDK